jgi:hypothetical protein
MAWVPLRHLAALGVPSLRAVLLFEVLLARKALEAGMP